MEHNPPAVSSVPFVRFFQKTVDRMVLAFRFGGQCEEGSVAAWETTVMRALAFKGKVEP